MSKPPEGPIAGIPEDVLEKYRLEREKRLRSDGIKQYRRTRAEFASFANDPNVDPDFQRPPLNDEVECALIGGGFAMLLAGARLRQAGFKSIRFIERAGDFGGTWYWNQYPGAQCDIEAYIYLPLLEEMGYMPRHRYAFGPEIRAHSQNIAKRFDLYADACFQTGVTSMEWDDVASRWIISTDRGDRIRARFVAMAQGPLSTPKLPGIPGIETFEGKMFHTSRWDYKYTGGKEFTGDGDFAPMPGLANKAVGIIGTGATAVQCIPHLARSANKLFVFQRTPSAVDVRNNTVTDPAWVETCKPGWQKERMKNFEILVSGGEQDVDLVSDGWTEAFRRLTGVAARKAAQTLGRALTAEERRGIIERADFECMEQIRQRVDKVVRDPETAEALKPWYKRWCKRPGFHDEYLDAFNLPNVRLVDTNGRGVDRVTEDSVIVGDESFKVDCLIFATGFEVGTPYTERAGFDVIGRDGLKLSEKWSNGFRTFHGMFVHGFPNCFFFGLTQSGYTINYTHALDEQANHLAYVLKSARDRNIIRIEAAAEAEAEWVEEIERLARRGQHYYEDCTPSYNTNEGDIESTKTMGFSSGAYGGGATKFFEILEEWRSAGTLPGLELSNGA